jgi:adenosylhomocysteine nucleosidase
MPTTTPAEDGGQPAGAGRAPIAVICALPHELTHLRAALPPGQEEWRNNRCAWVTEIDGHPIILTLCGIKMVSAAAVAEAIVTQYQPAAVLNFGCAGAHRADLLPGDLVIGVRTVAYDSIAEYHDGTERYTGMRYLHQGEQQLVEYLPADPLLLERACLIAERLEGQHEPWPPAIRWPSAAAHRSPRHVVGTVASADRWNRTPASIAAIVRQHDSVCEDMEAAAIALVCASHDVPFLTIKDISNNELLDVTDNGALTVGQLGEQIGRRAGALTLALLRDLVATWTRPSSVPSTAARIIKHSSVGNAYFGGS